MTKASHPPGDFFEGGAVQGHRLDIDAQAVPRQVDRLARQCAIEGKANFKLLSNLNLAGAKQKVFGVLVIDHALQKIEKKQVKFLVLQMDAALLASGDPVKFLHHDVHQRFTGLDKRVFDIFSPGPKAISAVATSSRYSYGIKKLRPFRKLRDGRPYQHWSLNKM